MNYSDRVHRLGRTSLVIGILMFISYPLFSCIFFNAWPDGRLVMEGLFAIVPIFWTVGIIEAFTFGPMLGSGGAYLGFITGNLSAMKVPVALQAMEISKTTPNSDEGDAVGTIAIAISSIVTTLILIVGLILLSQLRPVLESPSLTPAFANILPALFGGLGVVFLSKRWKIALAPLILMLLLFIFVPGMSKAVSLLVPVSALVTVAIARLLYKKNLLYKGRPHWPPSLMLGYQGP